MRIQETFVKHLKKTWTSKASLADSLSVLLGISKDSVYRRLRNETPFSIEEAMMICDTYKVDLTQFFEFKYQTIPFRFTPLHSGDRNLLKYLDSIYELLSQAHLANVHVTFAAEDIPVFHHFADPLLAGFKLFYWQKAVLNDESLLAHKFNPEIINPDMIQRANEIITLYNQLDSTEIWTEDSIHSTLSQIMYFSESGQFEDSSLAFELLDATQQMLESIKQQAEMSSKLKNETKNFSLYNSEVRIGNNSIYMEAELGDRVFISHNTFNSISTDNINFCKETKSWMENLIRKSTKINDVSEKHRYQFFRLMYEKIENVRQRI